MNVPFRDDTSRAYSTARAAHDYLAYGGEDDLVPADAGDCPTEPQAGTSRLISNAYISAFLTLSSVNAFTSANAFLVQGSLTAPTGSLGRTRIVGNATTLFPRSWVIGSQSGTRADDDASSSLTTSRASVADSVTMELARLKDGWDGAGSISPNTRIKADVQAVLEAMPSRVSMPEMEVEPDDGTVALRWISPDLQASFSLVFRGDGKVTGVLSKINPPRSTPWTAEVSDDVRIAGEFEAFEAITT